MSRAVNKEDVPVYGHPALWIFLALNLIGIFIVGMLVEPKSRPGVVESIIGFAWAYVLSRPSIRTYIAYLEHTAVQSKENTLLKILPVYFRKEWAHDQITGLLFLMGLFVVVMSAFICYLIMPSLPAPWARYGSIESDFPIPIQSMPTSVFIYIVAYGLFLSSSIIHWFITLPKKSI